MAGKNRRWAERQTTTGGTVEIDGQSLPLIDWSASGFLATSYAGDHRRGNRVKVRFAASLPDRKLEFSCRAIVIKADPERGELAAKFVGISDEAKSVIAEHFGFHIRRWRL
jgi:hypothetical protein